MRSYGFCRKSRVRSGWGFTARLSSGRDYRRRLNARENPYALHPASVSRLPNATAFETVPTFHSVTGLAFSRRFSKSDDD